MNNFYDTEIEIRAGFGPVGTTERKRVWADNEQLLRAVFYAFTAKKIKIFKKYFIVRTKVEKT